MPKVCRIKLDASKYHDELSKVEASARDAAEKVQKIGDGAGATAKEGAAAMAPLTSAISAVGAAAGVSIPPVNALSAALKALKAGAGLIGLALGVFAAVAVKVWDRLTVSTEEFAAKMRGSSAEAQRHAERIGSLDSAAQGYLDRLRELSSTEGAANAARSETLSLLGALERQYGDLGAEIDATTGRVSNLLEVEQRLREARGRRAAEGYEKQRAAAMGEAKAEYIKSQGWEFDWRSASDFDKLAGLMPAERLAAEFRRQRDQSKDGTEIEHLNAAIAKLEEAAEAERKRSASFTTGYATEEERQSALGRRQAEATKAKLDLEEAKKRALEQQSDAAFAAAATPQEKIDNRRERIAAEQERQQRLLEQEAAARREVADAVTDGDGERLADAERGLSEAQRAVVESMQREAALWDQIRQIEREREKKEKEFAQSISDKAFDLYGRAMERVGSGAAFAEEKALRDARHAKGSDLTDEEADQVRSLAKLSRELGDLKEINLSGQTIRTNSLTARGGFASAAVVPDSDRINRSIEGYNRKQTDLLQKIFDLWQSMERG